MGQFASRIDRVINSPSTQRMDATSAALMDAMIMFDAWWGGDYDTLKGYGVMNPETHTLMDLHNVWKEKWSDTIGTDPNSPYGQVEELGRMSPFYQMAHAFGYTATRTDLNDPQYINNRARQIAQNAEFIGADPNNPYMLNIGSGRLVDVRNPEGFVDQWTAEATRDIEDYKAGRNAGFGQKYGVTTKMQEEEGLSRTLGKLYAGLTAAGMAVGVGGAMAGLWGGTAVAPEAASAAALPGTAFGGATFTPAQLSAMATEIGAMSGAGTGGTIASTLGGAAASELGSGAASGLTQKAAEKGAGSAVSNLLKDTSLTDLAKTVVGVAGTTSGLIDAATQEDAEGESFIDQGGRGGRAGQEPIEPRTLSQPSEQAPFWDKNRAIDYMNLVRRTARRELPLGEEQRMFEVLGGRDVGLERPKARTDMRVGEPLVRPDQTEMRVGKPITREPTSGMLLGPPIMKSSPSAPPRLVGKETKKYY